MVANERLLQTLDGYKTHSTWFYMSRMTPSGHVIRHVYHNHHLPLLTFLSDAKDLPFFPPQSLLNKGIAECYVNSVYSNNEKVFSIISNY